MAYFTVTNAFAALRLLPMSDRDKDVEILALRHQIMVLQRQLGADVRVRFGPRRLQRGTEVFLWSIFTSDPPTLPGRAGGCTPDTPPRQDGGHARDPRLDQTSLDQRLTLHAKEHWPQLVTVHVRYHGQFAYVEGQLIDGVRLPLMRLRYGGSATSRGLAIHTPSNDRYEAAPFRHP